MQDVWKVIDFILDIYIFILRCLTISLPMVSVSFNSVSHVAILNEEVDNPISFLSILLNRLFD